MSKLERLGSLDMTWLQIERDTNLMHVVGVLQLETPLDRQRLEERLQTRLLRLERFGQHVLRDSGAELIVNLRDASLALNKTLEKANGSLDTLDEGVIQKLPETMAKLDRTLAALESASNNANGILGDNRESINGFAQNGLGQVGPTLTELRSLIRDLRRVATRLDRNPGGYITGRTRPEEFEPK